MDEQEDLGPQLGQALGGRDRHVHFIAHARGLDDNAQNAGFDEFTAEGDNHDGSEGIRT